MQEVHTRAADVLYYRQQVTMGRFLLFYSYIGAEFCGLQKQSNTVLPTVVGTLERAFECLRPANEIHLVTSSRTDKGVHALCNSGHIDLVHRNAGEEYQPGVITEAVNQRMFDYKAPIREPVDMSLVHQAAELLVGTHNFLGFSSPKLLVRQPWLDPVKTLDISIKRTSSSFMQDYMPYYTDNFTNYDLIFHSKSFLFRQVRKMAAVILGVGRGEINLSDIERVLECPEDNRLRKTSVFHIPAYALYLAQVHYDEKDLRDPSGECDKTDLRDPSGECDKTDLRDPSGECDSQPINGGGAEQS